MGFEVEKILRQHAQAHQQPPQHGFVVVDCSSTLVLPTLDGKAGNATIGKPLQRRTGNHLFDAKNDRHPGGQTKATVVDGVGEAEKRLTFRRTCVQIHKQDRPGCGAFDLDEAVE